MISLSILDQSPVAEGSTPETALQQTVELAKMAEKLGYKRFWVSEHHFSRNLAGSSPEVLMSYLAAKTEKIRIGSGGVMLPHYSAYKVAENFRVLEGLAPGRIDAGLGRAPGGMPIASMALQGRRGADRYPEQIGDLVTYLYDQADEHHRFPNLTASPKVGSAPDVWLLGSSGESAGLAAQVGASYTFAQFINGEGGEDAVRLYKERFKPSILGDQPRSTVAVFVLCAETEEAAERLAKSLDYSLLANEQGMVTEGFPSLDTALSYQYSPYEKKRIEATGNAW